MPRKAYARRYAQAVFEIALEKKELERWQSDLKKIVSLAGDATIEAVLDNPKLNFEDKVKLLAEQLKDISPLALNLVRLLVTRGRLGMIGDIAEEYQRLMDNYYGIEQAEITTAVPLDDDDKARVANYLSEAVGKKVVLKARVDPHLVGGIIARIDDKLLDGSTRTRLEALKKELAGVGRLR